MHHFKLIPEREFMGLVKQQAWLLGWRLQYHTHDSRRSDRGFPDLVLVREPRVLFIEVKKESGHITGEQHEWLEGLQKSGMEAYLWRPSDQAQIDAVLA
jgi:hypothetical protein